MLTPAKRSRSGSIGPAIPVPRESALGGVAAQRLLGHAALARDLHAALEHGVGIFDHAVEVLVVGVHPHLAPGALNDRRGLPAVVGVRVRAHDQPRLLQAQVAHLERPLQMRDRVGLVHAGVEQHEAVAPRDRPGVAVGHARPRQRQAQPVEPRKHALAAPQLAPGAHIWHGAQTRLRSFCGVKEAGDGRSGECQRGEHQGAGGRREHAAGGGHAQTHLGEQGGVRRAALLRGDRRTQPRAGRGAVGGRRPRERARPGGRDWRRRACASSSAG